MSEQQSSADSVQPMASDWPDNSYVYRFEYVDGSAFEVLEDGRAFIVYKDGRREEKRGKIDSRIRLLVGRAVKPLHDLLRANGITGAPVRARSALPTREEVIGECLSAMPSTAEDPNESSYQRGRFDGVMEYQREIRKLPGTEPQTAPKLEALESCKGEQLKFEEWAAAEKYDMHEHPLHYLFMDDKTNAARQGWKAALRYAATVIAGAQCQAVNAPALDPATVEACAKFVEQHQETIREAATGTERYLAPRKVGNLMGVAYVDGLRALTRPVCEGK